MVTHRRVAARLGSHVCTGTTASVTTSMSTIQFERPVVRAQCVPQICALNRIARSSVVGNRRPHSVAGQAELTALESRLPLTRVPPFRATHPTVSPCCTMCGTGPSMVVWEVSFCPGDPLCSARSVPYVSAVFGVFLPL